MSFSNTSHSRLTSTAVIAVCLVCIITPYLSSQEITLTIAESSGRQGDKLVPIDIFISTTQDTIAAFNFWIQLDRPDIISFSHDTTTLYDTSFYECLNWSGSDCLDSVQVLGIYPWDFFYVDSIFDTISFVSTTGSPIVDWGTSARSLSNQYYDANIVSIIKPGETNYLYPPLNNQYLMTLYADVSDNFPFPPMDSIVNMFVQKEFLNHFNFVTPSGESIGLTFGEILDTNCYICTDWLQVSPNDSICTNYILSPLMIDCDSISVEIDTTAVLDTSYFEINSGIFTLLPSCGYDAGNFDISNLVALVDFMFSSGPELGISEADCNCDCLIDVSDLVCFVDYMFNGGSSPGCEI